VADTSTPQLWPKISAYTTARVQGCILDGSSICDEGCILDEGSIFDESFYGSCILDPSSVLDPFDNCNLCFVHVCPSFVLQHA